MDNSSSAAASLVSLPLMIGFALGMYILMALPLYTMGNKIGSSNSWFAFVPILNILLMLEIAGKELWWLLLCFIPCVNLVIYIIIWMAIAERMDKPSWVGLLLLVPGLNILMPFYLAFG